MNDSVHEPGDPVPVTGRYEELNLFGSPTGKVLQFSEGVSLPRLPRHQTWRLVRPPALLEVE
jgi:hypothetical protein